MDINSILLILSVLLLHCVTIFADWGCVTQSVEPCSHSCGGGRQKRVEKCCIAWLFDVCIGGYDHYEVIDSCNTDPCGGIRIPSKSWTTWTSWSPCSVTCGQGTQQQSRSCVIDTTFPLRLPCFGNDSNTSQCFINPVHGEWGTWSDDDTCTKTCGGGTKRRTRSCDSPAPANCGNTCPGSSTDTPSCNTNCCPVNGNWGSWDPDSSQCSVTCGSGTRRLQRSCNNPSPKCGGSYCVGNRYTTETCSKPLFNGNWGTWEQWSQCSVTCGYGSQHSSRSCNYPVHGCHGSSCVGRSYDSKQCYIQPIHGGWSIWSEYSSCSKTCGGGQQTRTRACNTPTPVNCGKTCSGNMSQLLECNTQDCPPECYEELCNGNGCHDGEKCNCKAEYTGTDCNIDCRIREFPGPCREKRDECVALADKLICPCETQSERNLTCIYHVCDQMHCSRHGICFEKKAMSISNPLIYCICNKGYTGYDCSNYIPTAAPNSSAPPISATTQRPVEESYITNVWPTYGPKAGGTVITLDGQNLPLGSIVQIGNELICETVHVNGTRLLGITPKLTPSVLDIINKEMPITVNMDSDEELKSTFKFVYKENPSIWKVYPTSTIIQGGTELTVLGSNLDSVAVITMETSMVLKEIVQTKPTVYAVTTTEYITSCTILNSTQMVCVTPNIDLPPEFDIGGDRSKRELNSPVIKPISNTRVKRDLQIELSNDGDILEFYIGFTMDGVDDYQNYTVIDVFVQPEFHLDQQTWKYDENTRLTFKGEHLDVGVTVHDYKVMIETVQCGQLELLSNELSCLPPDASPELMEGNDDANPRIMIQVGLNIQHVAGYISYTDNQLPVYVIALASVLPACAVIVVVVAVGVVCVRKRPGEK